MSATQAVVRGISDTFEKATVMVPTAQRIDVALARVQHAAYVAALRATGLTVTELPPLHQFPDGCFVEDCAIVGGDMALITRPGTPSRVGEETTIAAFLRDRMKIEEVVEPMTIEGGDCMRVGRTWFVGHSSRTNAGGAAHVAETFGPLGYQVIDVPVGPFLHLKCVCSRVDDETIVLADETIPASTFKGFKLLMVPKEESYASNVVSHNGTALMSAGFPKTESLLRSAGLKVLKLDGSEIRKADGSLTCLSILF